MVYGNTNNDNIIRLMIIVSEMTSSCLKQKRDLLILNKWEVRHWSSS